MTDKGPLPPLWLWHQMREFITGFAMHRIKPYSDTANRLLDELDKAAAAEDPSSYGEGGVHWATYEMTSGETTFVRTDGADDVQLLRTCLGLLRNQPQKSRTDINVIRRLEARLCGSSTLFNDVATSEASTTRAGGDNE